MPREIADQSQKKSSGNPQEKFIRSTFYVIAGIMILIFILIQPYNLFCRLGSTCKPITLSSLVLRKHGTKELEIHFTGMVPENLKQSLEFYPDQQNLKVINGKNIINFYKVKNLTNKNIVVAIKFKIEPTEIEKYLERTDCICFKNKPLGAKQEAEMPLNFRINPEIEKDSAFDNLKEIKVNYSVDLLENVN